MRVKIMVTKLDSRSSDADAPNPHLKEDELCNLVGEKEISVSNSDESFENLEVILACPSLKRNEIRKIWKNLILICLAFVGNFIAFNGASALQSSLNAEAGLVSASLSVIYAAIIISAMFLPAYVIDWLGCKWTIVVAICGYVTYYLANFYPHWGTLIPSSIILGLSAAPLWSAKCTYLTTSAKRYALLTNDITDAVVNRFFGVFFLFFQSSLIIGNLLSSFVLSADNTEKLEFPTCYNETLIEQICGKNDCQGKLSTANVKYNSSDCSIIELESSGASNSAIYILMGIYTASGLCGALISAVGVDNIKVRSQETRGPFALLIASFNQMKDKRQLLLIPITMYSGFEMAFLTGDFTRSFVTCPLGVNWVGFVFFCYGACDAIFSPLVGVLEKFTGRIFLLTAAALISIGAIITMQVWTPYPSQVPLFFILSALWGISDAVWQTQLNALYGVLFFTNQEASFANYRLWESVGFVVAFAYQNFICLSTKLWVLLSVVFIGMTLYYYVEYQERQKIPEKGKVAKNYLSQ